MNPTFTQTFTPTTFPIPLPPDNECPKEIHVRGKNRAALDLLYRLPDHGLAIVGPRSPSLRAERFLYEEFPKLSQTPLVVVSGFARGIDAIAHRMAIAHGIPTVAVLGTGLDILYPHQNAELKNEILESGGLLISELPNGYPPLKHSFTQRNRLIAYFSKALWVVEAARRSGTLNTARWGRDYHRDVYATPSFPGEIKNIGAQDLIDDKHAVPFWGAHSLSQTWLDLITLKTPF